MMRNVLQDRNHRPEETVVPARALNCYLLALEGPLLWIELFSGEVEPWIPNQY